MGRARGPESTTTRIEDALVPIIRKYSDGSISDGIWAMEGLIKNSGTKPYVITLEELKAGIRGVVRIEGVIIDGNEKREIKDLARGVLSELQEIKRMLKRMEGRNG